MLRSSYSKKLVEAGLDEAGRGCLAGPVVAAAVILPRKYKHAKLTDSKKLSRKKRTKLREEIIRDAVDWSIAIVDNKTIDEMNILNASFYAMHEAIDKLATRPELLLIDGNRFNPYEGIHHECIVKGDSTYLSIAAASILAKTFRDEYMETLHEKYPVYQWHKNVGYPTPFHRRVIQTKGISPYHRKTFKLLPKQLEIFTP
jgi:ribonuclease HII